MASFSNLTTVAVYSLLGICKWLVLAYFSQECRTLRIALVASMVVGTALLYLSRRYRSLLTRIEDGLYAKARRLAALLLMKPVLTEDIKADEPALDNKKDTARGSTDGWCQTEPEYHFTKYSCRRLRGKYHPRYASENGTIQTDLVPPAPRRTNRS